MKHIQTYKRIWDLLMIIASLTAVFFLMNAYCTELLSYIIVPFTFIFLIILLMIIRLQMRYQRLEKALLYDAVENVVRIPSYEFEALKQYFISREFILLDLKDVIYAMHPDHNVVVLLYQTDQVTEIIHSHKQEIQSYIKQHQKKRLPLYTYVIYKDTLTKEELARCIWKNKGVRDLTYGYEVSTSSLHYLKNFPCTLTATVNEDYRWINQEILAMFQLESQESSAIFSFQPYLKAMGFLMLVSFLAVLLSTFIIQDSPGTSTQETHTSSIYDMELQTLTFEVDDDIYMLGEPLINFYEEGWSFEDETQADIIVPPNTPSSSYIKLTRNHNVFYASFYNSANEPQVVKDCELIAIMQSERMPSASIDLPKGIKIGSTKEEVIQAYGPCEHIVDQQYQYTFAQTGILILTFDSYDRISEFTYSQF